MKSSHVKASVACYFRYKRQCPMVSFERPLKDYISNPDIFVINKKRMLVEIEVKVSMSDFKRDCLKRVWHYREKMPDLYPMPFQFYYAVPDELQEKALIVIDGWKKENKVYGNVGLLVVNPYRNIKFLGYDDVFVRKTAPQNKTMKKVSVKDIVKMSMNQSATLCSYAKRIAKMDIDAPVKPKKPKKPKKPRKPRKTK